MTFEGLLEEVKQILGGREFSELDLHEVERVRLALSRIYDLSVERRYALLHPPSENIDKPGADVTGPVEETDLTEISPNQISLIDSIEEIKLEQSINETFSEYNKPTISQQMAGRGYQDLTSVISINQKFKFISELFGGDADAYQTTVDRINRFSSYLEADDYLQNTLKNQYDWEMQNPIVLEFVELIERKFL